MKYLYLTSSLLLLTIFLALFSLPDNNFHLIACNVGQGDAILATYGNIQILTDGGPGNRVLDCLSKHMPFYDREIELVILTHPQLDHFGGLIEVVRRYKVDTFMANAVDNSAQAYSVLKKEVGGRGIRIINPKEGMIVRLGKIHLDIVNPTDALLSENTNGNSGNILGVFTTKRDLNDFSIVDIVSFGNYKALLTGDIGPSEIPDVLSVGRLKPVNYIKVPHHGSKNGLTPEFLDVVNPEIAVISVGRNNSYGHPHEEILKLLRARGIKTLRTDEVGDIEIVTDGERWWMKN